MEELVEISDIGEEIAMKLYDAGYETKDDLRRAEQQELTDVEGVGMALAARIKADVGDVETTQQLSEYLQNK